MTLHVDRVAESALASLTVTLRSERLANELTQNEVAFGMDVRGRAISEWESGTIQPKLRNLIEWSRRLNHRLVILGRVGEPLRGPSHQRPGETWEHFERRRLAVPLRNRRQALGLSQTELGELVGVSRDSIQRWELSRVPPRPIAHVVWAQKLGYSLVLLPTSDQRHRDTEVADDCLPVRRISLPEGSAKQREKPRVAR